MTPPLPEAGADRDLVAFLDQAPVGFVTTAADGTILDANRTLLGWLGVARSELSGRFHDLLPPGQRVIWHARYLPELERLGRINGAAVDLVGPAGSLPVLVSGAMASSEDGRPLIRLTVVDATERRAYERELLAARRAAEDAEARLRALNDELHRMATHDSLTGLVNRHRLTELLGEAMGRSSVALLFVDLDRFKAVNDTLGHAAGDDVLVAVADRLRSAVRAGDVVARMGGDEFVVLCEGADRAAAQAVAVRIQETLKEPAVIAGTRLPLSASVGVAVAEPGDADAERLLARADEAMYAVKRSRS